MHAYEYFTNLNNVLLLSISWRKCNMRHFGLHITILTLMTACSSDTTSVDQNDQLVDRIQDTQAEFESQDFVKIEDNSQKNSNRLDKWMPNHSEITNPKYSLELLFKSWAHNLEDDKPAFEIDNKAFRIFNGGTFPFILHNDTIEIFEYHHDETSKGVITKLTADSLIIRWTTGDENKYVPYKE